MRARASCSRKDTFNDDLLRRVICFRETLRTRLRNAPILALWRFSAACQTISCWLLPSHSSLDPGQSPFLSSGSPRRCQMCSSSIALALAFIVPEGPLSVSLRVYKLAASHFRLGNIKDHLYPAKVAFWSAVHHSPP